MSQSLQIDFPDELLSEATPEQLEALAREAFYVRLYQEGKLSSGRAGALLGLTRSAFLDLLGRYGVSYFDDHTDLAADLQSAQTGASDRDKDASHADPVG